MKRRKYDAGFKQEVLQMVSPGRPVNEIAQSLGIGENLIYKRKSRPRHMVHLFKGGKGVDFAQIEALNRRIRELETERNIDPMLTHVCGSISLTHPWLSAVGSGSPNNRFAQMRLPCRLSVVRKTKPKR